MRSTTIVFFVLLVTSLCIQCDDSPELVRNASSQPANYLGDQACQSCHQKESELWQGSHHDWAMAGANEETVFGDFNDRNVTLDGVQYTFRQDAGKYIVDVIEPDGTEEVFAIDYTFGVTPLQQYITELDGGKHQVLRASWDRLENKWFHQYEDQRIETDDWLHWTNGGQSWNTMCAECHSTNLKRNYDWVNDTFHTTWSLINVSCESCHGPAEHHAAWATDDPSSPEKYMTVARDQQGQIDQCAACHARRVRLKADLEHGTPFEEQYILQTATPEFYHPDGQIREEDYVTGSFLQSKMFMHKVKCTDCHDPHSMELKFEGNQLCLQCHVPEYDTPEHHFHEAGTEQALCINCHMTGQVYMGNDFRRDHSFRIPRPDQSLTYGTPNACTGCHTDNDDAWAAKQIVDWYGDTRPPHYSDALLLSTKTSLTPEERATVLTFINDVSEPYLTRATAIDNYLLRYEPSELEALYLAMSDSSALVRRVALMKFADAPAQDRHAIALQHLQDTARMVRIAVAELTGDLDPSALLSDQQQGLNKARSEYEEMLISNMDFPAGRMQMADYLFRQNRVPEAILQYEWALYMDSLLYYVYPNLATAYSADGRNIEAMSMLNKIVELQPEYGRGYFLRALLNYELKNEEAAIGDFGKAIAFDPGNLRAFYNLSTLYYQRKEFSKAEKTITEGLELFPDSQDSRYLLALIYKEQGRISEYQEIMSTLQ